MSFFENKIDTLVYMTSTNITTTHAFTTRFGGVSDGIYKSLNLAQRANDEQSNVENNYSILCKTLGISTDNIVCSTQVHGTNVRIVTQDDRGGLFRPNSHQADALITNSPNVALMVFTADCVPILLHNPVKNVIGAVHAGWRSAVANITGITIKKMQNEFNCSPTDIRASIGPCISKCCFETDADVADAVKAALPLHYDICVTKSGNKFMIDLKEINRIMLSNAGIEHIEITDECTSCLSDKYWSHRKTQGQRGSQAAVIQL